MLTNSGNLGDLGFGFKSVGRGLKKVGKAGVRVAVAPIVLPTVVAYKASKALSNLALRPVRSQLNKLKNRRAAKLAWDARKSKVPTVVEKAQARKDTKAMLSRKGPHGKMLALLAGGPMFAGELGVVGYDDAAYIAAAGLLTALAKKVVSNSSKGSFAPADPSTVPAGAPAEVAPAPGEPEPPVTPEEAPAAPVTQEEVATEPAVAAEEASDDEQAQAMEGALAGAGLLGSFMDALPAAAAPEAMDLSLARQLASAAQRLVCNMPAEAIAAIGGPAAVNVVGTFCQSLAAGNDAGVRATLPPVVQIAARAAANEGFGCANCLGAPKRKSAFKACKQNLVDQGYTPIEATYSCLGIFHGADLGTDEIGMLAAFAGADPEGLAFGLAGVGAEELAATSAASDVPVLAMLPVGFAVLAGLWMATRG